MTPWNLLPLRERVSPWRRVVMASGLAFSACSGAALVAWLLSAQSTRQAQVQADVLAAQTQLAHLKKQTEQERAAQTQWQQAQARWQQLGALRQRALRLDAVQQASLQRWPAAVQVQSWRIEGGNWQLQGMAESGVAVQQLAQDLSPWGPWQQTPTLVELAAVPQAPGQTAGRVRYVLQARWREDEGLTPAANASVSPAPPKASVTP